MPIYEYECNDCSHQFEAMRKISAGPPDACPECGKGDLRKMVSKAAFRLKGTGWYETDFKDKPKNDDKKKSSTDSSAKDKDKGETSKKDESSTSKPAETKKSTSKSED